MPATVYVDRRALVMAVAGARATRLRRRPDLRPAIRHLRDAGHPVVLVDTRESDRPPATTVHGRRVPEVDLPDGASGWLVTADADLCGTARRRGGLRTVLVGPYASGTLLASRTADVEARDLMDAVLGILSAEAMSDGHHGPGAIAHDGARTH